MACGSPGGPQPSQSPLRRARQRASWPQTSPGVVPTPEGALRIVPGSNAALWLQALQARRLFCAPTAPRLVLPPPVPPGIPPRPARIWPWRAAPLQRFRFCLAGLPRPLAASPSPSIRAHPCASLRSPTSQFQFSSSHTFLLSRLLPSLPAASLPSRPPSSHPASLSKQGPERCTQLGRERGIGRERERKRERERHSAVDTKGPRCSTRLDSTHSTPPHSSLNNSLLRFHQTTRSCIDAYASGSPAAYTEPFHSFVDPLAHLGSPARLRRSLSAHRLS